MKRQVYKSKYLEIFYHPDKKMIESVYTPESENYTDDKYKKEVEILSECIANNDVNVAFSNITEFKYVVVPEIQEWIAETFFPVLVKSGIRKIAMLTSESVFSQVSVEQTMAEAENVPFETRYFKNKQEAMDWLFK